MRARVYSYRQVIESEYSSSVESIPKMSRAREKWRVGLCLADDGLALPARSPVDDSGRPPRY